MSLAALLGRYRELLGEVDVWFDQGCRAAGEQVACQRGCSACCRGLFDITLLDGYLLHDGLQRLPVRLRNRVELRAQGRMAQIRTLLPDFTPPYLLNSYPEPLWDTIMPDDDETPCPLLDEEAGICLVYDSRPMTCRLHGLPMIDTSGEVLFGEWCSLNFTDADPLQLPSLRAPFNDIFRQEQLLFREFTRILLGRAVNELDTLIPAAVLIDFTTIALPEQLWSKSSS